MTEQAAAESVSTTRETAKEPAAGPADGAAGTGTAAAGDAPVAEPAIPVEEDEGPAAEETPETAVDEAAVHLAALEAEKADLDRRVAELKDRLLRAAADFDNYRKRVARQELETLERSRIEALRMFLPVVDNVERALGFAEKMTGGEQVAQGLQMVLRGFFDTFSPQGLVRIESVGKPFDPACHEAVGQLQTEETPAGCVAQEVQAGYLLKERLLRPALVVVARPPASATTTGAPAADEIETPAPSTDGPEKA